MDLAGKKVGFALTGSHCTLAKVIPTMEKLVGAGADVYPIISKSVQENDTRFGTAKEWRKEVVEITGNQPITTIPEAEPIGPQKLFDILVVAPCTGNTLAKIANGITDTPVTMAVKAQLRNSRPVVLAVATNDALGNNGKNIGMILNTPHIYFVPLGQDNPIGKPNSLVARMDLIVDTARYALEGKQLQPVIIEYKGV
ncbi:dipicolinic acid synthetase, B subunit [Halobacteroides halobius DSM 5150]|uniref:Dipicolinic acid synthetase, B subunit n=1 Tax=Halobacteroides halobius (strain ATCC 35273 / DSM 5150 / MD-1) TaxID=748449 RepID=L0K8K1_HALHC|nr:dipicolinate synthase subunit B [Halobacteroides halobius]AGB40694.1 dipicolinic acid synthetase, B subunit [Halobacteroides halobius DSM 5150]